MYPLAPPLHTTGPENPDDPYACVAWGKAHHAPG
jgi:hypothetical protein